MPGARSDSNTPNKDQPHQTPTKQNPPRPNAPPHNSSCGGAFFLARAPAARAMTKPAWARRTGNDGDDITEPARTRETGNDGDGMTERARTQFIAPATFPPSPPPIPCPAASIAPRSPPRRTIHHSGRDESRPYRIARTETSRAQKTDGCGMTKPARTRETGNDGDGITESARARGTGNDGDGITKPARTRGMGNNGGDMNGRVGARFIAPAPHPPSPPPIPCPAASRCDPSSATAHHPPFWAR